jgi:hypothetical protein
MQKTEVYSWRLSRQLKGELEEAARVKRTSLAELLEQIASDWLERGRDRDGTEEDRQQRLRAEAMKFVGVLQGGNPDRAENSRSEVRSRIAKRHGR